MHPFHHHVFVCDQRKPEGLPSCSARGSVPIIEALRREVAARNLFDSVQVTSCGSLGLCESGPNLVVYPEGVWYCGVSADDVAEIVTEHLQGGRPVERLMRKDEPALKQEIGENRARMTASLRARDAAGTMPDDLMESIRAYQASRILLTAVELDVFTAAARAEAPADAAALARALTTDSRATAVLLDALVALGLLTKHDGAYANTPTASRFLVAGAKDDATMALRHNLSLWETWSDLTEVVRQGHPIRHEQMAARGDTWTTPFIAAMHKNASLRAPMVVRAVGVEGVWRLLDIGGGSGAYSIAFAQASPTLEAEVFDLATVVPIAQRHVAEAKLADRVKVRVGDLRHDDFGSGFDLALLSAICHMLGPTENRDLFRRTFAALAPGGRLAVQDHVMTPDKTAPRSGALFAVNMLVGTPTGGTYSEAEYGSWLHEAGFGKVVRVALAGPNDLMIATK